MKYVIRNNESEFLTKESNWSYCDHDSFGTIKWGEDLKELKIFKTKKDALDVINKLPKAAYYDLVPIREFDAIELLKPLRLRDL